jgi:omega-hydroxy-beta-dihydromenaquinone-9 sulfotransferase
MTKMEQEQVFNVESHLDKMIFVVGSSRSGTTLLANILGRHPSVFAFNELHFFEELYVPSAAEIAISRDEALRLVTNLMARQRLEYARYSDIYDHQSFLQEATCIIESLITPIYPTDVFKSFLCYETVRHGKALAVEQTPRNVFYIKELLSQYPNAYVINMVRDARDIMLSQKYKWRRFWSRKDTPRKLSLLFWANYHPITVSMMWNSAVEAAKPFQGNERFIQVAFEDLVQNPAFEVNRICDLLEITDNLEMLAVSANSSHSPERDQEIGIRQDATGRWQKDKDNNRDLRICQKIAQENLMALKYELSDQLTVTYLDWSIALLSLPFKSILSLLLNLRRTRNLAQFLRRRILHEGFRQ